VYYKALVITALIACPTVALAGNPSGFEIAKKANADQSNYIGQRFDSIMQLHDASGKATVKYKMKQFGTEGTKANGNTTKTLIRFIAPPDSKGTALLTHETKGKEESRWLYLSETRQVKQIGGGSKSAPFKGSEIAYEDLNTDILDKYEYKNLGAVKVGGRPAWKVEMTPKFSDSGYSKVINYYDQEHSYPVQAEFYDKAGKLLKTSRTAGWKQIQGKWRSSVMEVKNVQTRRKTMLKSGNHKLKLKLSSKMFTVSQLQKQ
jgi:hypothetical protein